MAWYDDDAFGPEDLGTPTVTYTRYDRYLQTLLELDIEQMPFDDDTADHYMY